MKPVNWYTTGHKAVGVLKTGGLIVINKTPEDDTIYSRK
jgi:hypothetical protein